MAFPEERNAELDLWVWRRALERDREKAEGDERERQAIEAKAEAEDVERERWAKNADLKADEDGINSKKQKQNGINSTIK